MDITPVQLTDGERARLVAGAWEEELPPARAAAAPSLMGTAEPIHGQSQQRLGRAGITPPCTLYILPHLQHVNPSHVEFWQCPGASPFPLTVPKPCYGDVCPAGTSASPAVTRLNPWPTTRASLAAGSTAFCSAVLSLSLSSGQK